MNRIFPSSLQPPASSLKSTRKGAAAMIALLLIAVLGTFSAVLVKNLLRDQLQNRRNVVSEQVNRLVLDFRDRTESILQSDAEFNGETLELPTEADPFRGTYRFTSKINKDDGTMLISAEYRDETGKVVIDKEQTFQIRPEARGGRRMLRSQTTIHNGRLRFPLRILKPPVSSLQP